MRKTAHPLNGHAAVMTAPAQRPAAVVRPRRRFTEAEMPEIRSEEVQEILSSVPHWMVRWGITLIFAILCGLLALSWVVRYPDVIKGEITLSAANPPARLAAGAAGKLLKIHKPHGALVQAGEALAEIESPFQEDGVAYLQSYLRSARLLLQHVAAPLPAPEPWLFGPVQTAFNTLQKQCQEYRQWGNDPTEAQIGEQLREKISQYEGLLLINRRQEDLASEELLNAGIRYQATQSLFQDSVVSRLDYYKEQSEYRARVVEVENLKKNSAMDRITLIDLRKQLAEWEFSRQEKRRAYIEGIRASLAEVENGFLHWRQGYLLAAPASGKVEYIGNLTPNQYVQAGQELFVLASETGAFQGMLKIPTAGYGKIEVGQAVRVHLDNYPAHQYGIVTGKVAAISALPEEKHYRVSVEFPAGLKSSFGNHLTYLPNMTGSAEVVTEDLRVLERIFNSFRSLIR